MTGEQHELSFSNSGPNTVWVWLEPWADEIEVPAMSTITFVPTRNGESCPLGELEWAADHLILWADAEKVAVLIDGVAQNCGSAIIPVPSGLNKAMLGTMFAAHPPARLGGTNYGVAQRDHWWTKLKRRFGM